MAAWRGWVLLAGLIACPPLMAQTSARALDPCPALDAVTPAHLHGLWHFSFWAAEGAETTPLSRGALLFEAHPEYPGSVRGALLRSSANGELRAQVSGDVADGEFNLDESDDGVAMSAVWTGDLSPVDCRLDIQGTRRPAEGRPAAEGPLRFRLQKVPTHPQAR